MVLFEKSGKKKKKEEKPIAIPRALMYNNKEKDLWILLHRRINWRGQEPMKLLEDRIRKDGRILPGNVLKVDNFLNHQIDVNFVYELGKEFHRLYAQSGVNKILTIEASGIGIACLTARSFDCPVVFAKKHKTTNLDGEFYRSQVESYTHKTTYDVVVCADYLHAGDKVLIIDDFLAKGGALTALCDICHQAGAEIAGVGIVIEKAYQNGGKLIRNQGIRVESLAKIASMTEDSVEFC